MFLVCNILHSEEIKDQRWQIGSFHPVIDKQAHYLGGFAVFSMVERVNDRRIVQYSFVLLIAGIKETMDSYRTVGDGADVTYSILGAISCDFILTKMKLKTKKVKIGVQRNAVLLALNW
jgi:hypothetical protein